MVTDIAPAILPYLAGLESEVANLADTWRPDDPHYRADVYRQTMTSLSFAISESAASSRVGCLAHRHRFLGGIQVAAPPRVRAL